MPVEDDGEEGFTAEVGRLSIPNSRKNFGEPRCPTVSMLVSAARKSLETFSEKAMMMYLLQLFWLTGKVHWRFSFAKVVFLYILYFFILELSDER